MNESRAFRKSGYIGYSEYPDSCADEQAQIHVSEWWNGGGVDVTTDNFEGKSFFRLSMEDIDELFIHLYNAEMLDVGSLVSRAEKLASDMRIREEQIRNFKHD